MTAMKRDTAQPQYPAWDQPMTASEIFDFGEEFGVWVAVSAAAAANGEHYAWCRDNLLDVDWLTRKAHQHALEAITHYGTRLENIDGKILARLGFRRILKECEPDYPLYAWSLYMIVMLEDLVAYGLDGQLPHPYTDTALLPRRYSNVNGPLAHALLRIGSAVTYLETEAQENNDILLAEAIADAKNALEKIHEVQRLKAQADTRR